MMRPNILIKKSSARDPKRSERTYVKYIVKINTFANSEIENQIVERESNNDAGINSLSEEQRPLPQGPLFKGLNGGADGSGFAEAACVTHKVQINNAVAADVQRQGKGNFAGRQGAQLRGDICARAFNSDTAVVDQVEIGVPPSPRELQNPSSGRKLSGTHAEANPIAATLVRRGGVGFQPAVGSALGRFQRDVTLGVAHELGAGCDR